jgi:hypothetical protein
VPQEADGGFAEVISIPDFEVQRDRAYAVANAVSPEVLREIRNWIGHALETGASFELAEEVEHLNKLIEDLKK